jgi:hypothetical protein
LITVERVATLHEIETHYNFMDVVRRNEALDAIQEFRRLKEKKGSS